MGKEPSLRRRIEAISRTRTAAAAALATCLDRTGRGLTERTIQERWRSALADNAAVLPQGWYIPPPTGISVLISEPPGFTRTNFRSLRDPSSWPQQQACLEQESLLFVYASPVDRATAMIGDFAMTIYRGSNPEIRAHISTCLQITKLIVDHAVVGMELRELYDHAARLMRAVGLRNQTYRTAGRSSQANIGHTIPWSYGDYDQRIWAAVRTGDTAGVADLVSRARVFLTADETLRIGEDIAFTIEPQMASPGRPKVGFHVIVAFSHGVKYVSADYSTLLRQFNMSNYLPPELVRSLSDHSLPLDGP